MTDAPIGYNFYAGLPLPTDDVLAEEGRRLMERVWKHGATGKSREALIFIARDLRSGEIAACDGFLSGSNRRRKRSRAKIR